MFKVKNIETKETIQVLDTMIDDIFGATFFFVWENNGWRWCPAKNYVPPNYEIERSLI